MLVLSRKPGEDVRIGDDVVVSVLSVRGNMVKIGIQAPKSVPVHRQEIYARIHQEGVEPVPGQARSAPLVEPDAVALATTAR